MSARLVGVVGICKLKTLLAAMAQVSLVPRVGFAIFDDTFCLMAMNTGNLYYSHEAPSKVQKYSRSTGLIHHQFFEVYAQE